VAGRGPVVQVEGGARLRKTIKAAGDDLSDLRAAHARAAEIVVPRMRSGAPVGETGRLAASVRGSGTQTAAIIRAGSAAVPYAAVQEWGWAAKNIPPQPYGVPAAEETEPQWYGAYLDEVEDILGRVKGA